MRIINIIEIISVVVPLLLSVGYLTLIERKVIGEMQIRKGPNVVGIGGILQPLADGLKLFSKEIVWPLKANRGIYLFAPIIGLSFAFLGFLVIPYGYGKMLSDANVGILYLLAVSSISVYVIIMSGWASNSKYSLFGSIRSGGQMVSYEVCMGIIILSVIILEGNLNISQIIQGQSSIWNFFPLFPICFIFFVCAVAETNRPPFDLTEGESELVSGFNVEYGSMKFALLFIAEYAHIILMSFILSLLFFGGSFNILLISLKLAFFLFLFVWIRATFPRIRYDLLMSLAWKSYLPFSLGFLIFFGSFLLLSNSLSSF